jgi:hypothetical protein
MKEIYKLEGEIDLSVEPNETRIKPILGDIWQDFGFWLEATGFMAYQAMKYREWNEEKTAEYVKNYIVKCLKDYKLKHNDKNDKIS